MCIHSTNFNYHLTFEWTTLSIVHDCLVYTQHSLMNTQPISKSCGNLTKKFIKLIRKHAAWKLKC
jgi:hypothetical protein